MLYTNLVVGWIALGVFWLLVGVKMLVVVANGDGLEPAFSRRMFVIGLPWRYSFTRSAFKSVVDVQSGLWFMLWFLLLPVLGINSFAHLMVPRNWVRFGYLPIERAKDGGWAVVNHPLP